MTGPARYEFLNETHEVNRAEDWNFASAQKVSVYNLHYFDDLSATRADERTEWHRNAIARWISENPPVHGLGWHAYPTSLRIINWVKWALAGNSLWPAAVASLAVQARHLMGNLETQLLGNHLFENGRALAVAGCFFGGAEGERWLSAGTRLIFAEAHEQFLPDGGHFELSPMYHAILLEGILDLINVSRAYGLESLQAEPGGYWAELTARMLGWLGCMSHPDGEISLFNDAATGVALRPSELTAYAGRLGIVGDSVCALGCTHLRDSGYVRWGSHDATAILDVASIGPDYIPGHAHADTLTFELSVYGRRCIVNSGTSTYAASRERQAERSTGAHNTVTVEGVDSSEVWGAFRVARRARPFDVSVSMTEADSWRVIAAHDGYQRLPGRPVHRRTWELGPQWIVVEDELSGRWSSAVARFHVHPDWSVASLDGAAATLRSGSDELHVSAHGAALAVEDAYYHPEFGKSVPTVCLSARVAGSRAQYALEWRTAQ